MLFRLAFILLVYYDYITKKNNNCHKTLYIASIALAGEIEQGQQWSLYSTQNITIIIITEL